MEKHQEIERSIIKKYRRQIWSKFIKGIKEYDLIQENDKIAVCISGGKDSFLLAKCMQELQKHSDVKFELEYITMDPGFHQDNVDKIKENATKLGLTNIEPTLLDAKLLHTQYQNFADKVLVDAPCSGLGVIRRKPDSRWRKEEELIKELPTLQQEILNSAAKCVKPGGVLVYSTCTTEEEENQTVIYQFLQDNKNFQLEVTGQFLPITKTTQELIQIWPHNDKMDGFFIARMKRNN